jgi:hypothetical protein
VPCAISREKLLDDGQFTTAERKASRSSDPLGALLVISLAFKFKFSPSLLVSSIASNSKNPLQSTDFGLKLDYLPSSSFFKLLQSPKFFPSAGVTKPPQSDYRIQQNIILLTGSTDQC